MRVAVVYPMPCDAWDTFLPFANRYVDTYNLFAAEAPHDLFFAFMNPKDDYQHSLLGPFAKIEKAIEIQVHTGGIDIGCAQLCAKELSKPEHGYDFAVFSTSRVYFHREGWLRRLVEAREKYGDGLYGATGSYECPNGEPGRFPNCHIRTVLYGCNPKHMVELARIYPVTDRASAHSFEAGDHNFAQWFDEIGLPIRMVTWDGDYDIKDCRKPDNIFRRGDQSNILCHDKHSDAYRDASPEEKRRLERITG